ncbi:hypothetical protein [Cryobacterium sp. GrIS_2_6]|uniref:hypothetical protein n=1 Tax=Cryobacterium sp. GrIS_2_6 TaxID=3162785 RepID=UPI002DF95297|nr:hypothetical protein [Cryobacterium psychrotolerans]
MIQTTKIRPRRTRHQGNRTLRSALLERDPNMAATRSRGLTHHVLDREGIQYAGEHVALIDGFLHQLRVDAVLILAIKVKTKDPE